MLKRILPVLLFLFAAFCFSPAILPGALAADADTYSIDVDIANQITTVYRNSDRVVVRQMICSTGVNDKTPRGSFRLEKSRPTGDRSEWYYIGNYNCYVKYPTRIVGSILFHSIPYAAKDMSTIDREAVAQLGTKASHGCVRLRWEDARWIAMNCPDGTAVRIFTSPVGKSALRQKLMNRGYADMSGESYAQFVEGIPASDGSDKLGRGDAGEAVLAMQRHLTGLGFFSGRESGEYDGATIAAVTRYQAATGMRPTGVTDSVLFQRIMTEDAITGGYASLYPGVTGPCVSRLQEALNHLGLYDGEANGKYDRAVARSVEAYQRLSGIEPTGTASASLQSAIEDNVISGLRQGDRGPSVAALERALNDLQYYEGDCDDCYGLDTVMAVRFFTRVNGMDESAEATPEIQRAIFEQYARCERDYGSGGYALSLTDCETRVATARTEVKIYDKKSSASNALAILREGEEAVVVEAGRAWCLLSWNGKTGYARTRLLELSTRVDVVAEYNAPTATAAHALVYGSEESATDDIPSQANESSPAKSVNGIIIESYEAVPNELEFAFINDTYQGVGTQALS